jgi:hypothetical protein
MTHMGFISNLFINFLIGMAIIALLAGCASTGPAAEPPACRGVAFSINQPSPQTAGVK